MTTSVVTQAREPNGFTMASRVVSCGSREFPVAEPWWKLLHARGFKRHRFVATVWASDGSDEDVQILHDAASAGDIITLPAGVFPWTTGVSITKGIKLQGEGAGRVVARSQSSVLIGTGAKVFTLDSSSKLPVIEALKAAIVPDAILHIDRIGGAQSGGNPVAYARMTGTVTSLVGDTLTMDITSVEGSGTHPMWAISTAPITTIEKGNGNAPLIAVTGSGYAAHSLEFEGIRFTWSAGGAGTNDQMIQQNTGGGKPILIHDCYAEMPVGSAIFLYSFLPSGIVWNCSFLGRWWFNSSEPFIIKASGIDTWLTASTMGAADTTGVNNFYIEDCDWHGVQTGTDFSDNIHGVVRWCLLNNSGLGGHGADTSFYGMRHYEVYDAEFIFNGPNGHTLNISMFIYWRGGTGLVTDCIIPDINSSDYGNKTEIILQIQQLDRNAGPNPLWSDNDGQAPEYPCPRQIGMGRVTGTGLDGQGRSTDPNGGMGWAGTYVGDVEPIYIWGNSGGYAVGANTGFEGGGGEGIDPDLASDYIQAGRDYILDSAKPDYVKYDYPHPLRTDLGPDVTAPTLVAATIAATGTTLTLAFSEVVTGFDLSDFTLSESVLSGLVGSGFNRTCTITPAISEGAIVTIDYAGTTTKDTSDNPLTTFSDVAVNNESEVGGPGDPPLPPSNMILTALGP